MLPDSGARFCSSSVARPGTLVFRIAVEGVLHDGALADRQQDHHTEKCRKVLYPTAFALIFQSIAINLSMMAYLSGCMILTFSGITDRTETMYSEDSRCCIRSSSRYTPVAN